MSLVLATLRRNLISASRPRGGWGPGPGPWLPLPPLQSSFISKFAPPGLHHRRGGDVAAVRAAHSGGESGGGGSSSSGIGSGEVNGISVTVRNDGGVVVCAREVSSAGRVTYLLGIRPSSLASQLDKKVTFVDLPRVGVRLMHGRALQ